MEVEKIDKTRSGVILPSLYQFNGSDEDEPIVCAWFGCMRHLDLNEQKFGKYCVHHQNRKKFDVTLFISHPIKK